ncbi:hypothetical protein EV702DRAFT_1143659 [Suillus placidus]|uniref:Secreted protein n=1 Tax=Suillus placidus TaxID=48579 RepID=A0A9P6ZJJ5_9AGAM|nr:hypothetical protein EV702DRAFT_1143659 [Suillus placidus]
MTSFAALWFSTALCSTVNPKNADLNPMAEYPLSRLSKVIHRMLSAFLLLPNAESGMSTMTGDISLMTSAKVSELQQGHGQRNEEG